MQTNTNNFELRITMANYVQMYLISKRLWVQSLPWWRFTQSLLVKNYNTQTISHCNNIFTWCILHMTPFNVGCNVLFVLLGGHAVSKPSAVGNWLDTMDVATGTLLTTSTQRSQVCKPCIPAQFHWYWACWLDYDSESQHSLQTPSCWNVAGIIGGRSDSPW